MSVELQTNFVPVFQSNSRGVDGFDLSGKTDHAFTFDFDHTGKCDHLFFYGRGRGAVAILRNDGNGGLQAIYSNESGITGFDFSGTADRAFAFDYSSSGRLDAVCAYRPGAGLLTIMQNQAGNFEPVVREEAGVGTYDLKSAADRAFPFDFDHSGKRDHICIYRPGAGMFYIFKNTGGRFDTVYWKNTGGIGEIPFSGPADRAFAFDFDHSGCMDYIFCYRPGHSVISIQQNANGIFSSVWNMVNPYPNANKLVFYSFGGYDSADPADRAFPYDFDSTGKQDHICLYRPGKGSMFVVQHLLGGWWPAYRAHGHGMGITSTMFTKFKSAAFNPISYQFLAPIYTNGLYGAAGYDLKSTMDRCLPFDFESKGCMDYIVMYRPGAGILWIVRRADMPGQQTQDTQ